MLRHDIKLNNKHDFKLIFRWNESFKMREIDLIKKTYVLKKMNETRLNETYVENQLKRFKTWKMRIENVEKKKIDLTKFLKNAEKFKEMIEIAEKNFKENFEMKKKNFDQIKKLKKDRRNAQNSSKDVVKSIDDENEVFKNNVMIISFNYNVVKNAVVVVRTENETLRNIALKQKFSKWIYEKKRFWRKYEVFDWMKRRSRC